MYPGAPGWSLGYMPMAQGYAHYRRTGFEGLPGFGQGGLMGMFSMMAMDPLRGMMAGMGMTPFGLAPDQNVYDTILNQRFTQLQMQTMQRAASTDQQNFVKTAEGFASLAGMPFDTSQKQQLNLAMNKLTPYMPMMAEMMPDLLDQLGGRRGSNMVMMSQMAMAGRYRLDPVTGRMGMSQDTMNTQADLLYHDLFSDPNLADMRGLRAGQVGQLYGELQKRGMIPVGHRGQDIMRAAGEAGVAVPKGASAAELDKLAQLPEVSDKVRSFDVQRTKDTIKSWTSAIAAMRDIFGDSGQPNAPMQALMDALERATSGSVGKMDIGKLGDLVRQNYYLAKTSGVPWEVAEALGEAASGMAARAGIEPIFGRLAQGHGLAFGSAHRALGGSAVATWGAPTADALVQSQTALAVRAADSPAANQLAVLLRARATIAGGQFKAGTVEEAIAQAAQMGLGEYLDPRDNAVKSMSTITHDQFRDIMTGARGQTGRPLMITAGDVSTMLGQRQVNRESLATTRATESIIAGQGPEIMRFTGRRFQEIMAQRAQDAGATRAERDIMMRAGDQLAQQLFDGALTAAELADPARRTEAAAVLLEENIRNLGGGAFLGRLKDKGNWLRGDVESAWGRADQSFANAKGLMGGQTSLVGQLRQFDPRVQAQARQARDYAVLESETNKAFAAMTPGSMLRGIVTALQEQGLDMSDPDAVRRVISRSLGGIYTDELANSLMEPAAKFAAQWREVNELQQQIVGTKDTKEKARLTANLASKQAGLKAASDSLTQRFGGKGVLDQMPGGDQHSDISLDITQKQLDAFTKDPGEITTAEARAGMIADRRERLKAMRDGGKGDPETAAQVDAEVAKMKAEGAAGTPAELRAEAIERLEGRVREFDDKKFAAAAKAYRPQTDAGRRAVIFIRQAAEAGATVEEKADIENEYQDDPNWTPLKTEELARERSLSRRMNVDSAEVVARMAANPKLTEAQAHRQIRDRQEAKLKEVTAQDIAEFDWQTAEGGHDAWQKSVSQMTPEKQREAKITEIRREKQADREKEIKQRLGDADPSAPGTKKKDEESSKITLSGTVAVDWKSIFFGPGVTATKQHTTTTK